ncbi:amino acid ABC transporter permease [Leucobacter luti]|uniref:Amino acid ABC transporter membrane protein 2 (PAAT family) n=1 Tax=Leucobacter luti TaxID=340320 RepID=A0A4Q7U3Y1_9MICO|nr:amino acid ABC transporter permease [Leucobacter luti]MBL3700713.1 amino acid ABC transporter permease [Leucobacter luti]RZT68446.1 amino acid ABC transporter membrane protein 2 (PAAT family) [Leucobacter luti]
MQEFFTLVVALLPGLGVSIAMAAASIAVGIPLGFLAGLALNGKRKWLRVLAIVLVETFRGFPALLTLYLVYFGLASVVTLDRFTSIMVAFGLTTAAYTAEIFRASIASVPRGQIEAAEALALSRSDVTLRIIVPHVLNIAVPPLIGIAIITFQGTALAYAIGGKELLGSAYSIGMTNLRVLEPLLVAGFLYLVVTSLLAWMEVIADRRAERITGSIAHRRPPRKRGRGRGERVALSTRAVNIAAAAPPVSSPRFTTAHPTE